MGRAEGSKRSGGYLGGLYGWSFCLCACYACARAPRVREMGRYQSGTVIMFVVGWEVW